MELYACCAVSIVKNRWLCVRLFDNDVCICGFEGRPIKLHKNVLCACAVSNSFHDRHEHLKRNILLACLINKLEFQKLWIEVVLIVVSVDNIILCKNFRRDNCTLRYAVIIVCIAIVIVWKLLEIAELIVYRKSLELNCDVILAVLDFKLNCVVDTLVWHWEALTVGLYHLSIELIFAVREIIDIESNVLFLLQSVDSCLKLLNCAVYLFLSCSAVGKNCLCTCKGVSHCCERGRCVIIFIVSLSLSNKSLQLWHIGRLEIRVLLGIRIRCFIGDLYRLVVVDSENSVSCCITAVAHYCVHCGNTEFRSELSCIWSKLHISCFRIIVVCACVHFICVIWTVFILIVRCICEFLPALALFLPHLNKIAILSLQLNRRKLKLDTLYTVFDNKLCFLSYTRRCHWCLWRINLVKNCYRHFIGSVLKIISSSSRTLLIKETQIATQVTVSCYKSVCIIVRLITLIVQCICTAYLPSPVIIFRHICCHVNTKTKLILSIFYREIHNCITSCISNYLAVVNYIILFEEHIIIQIFTMLNHCFISCVVFRNVCWNKNCILWNVFCCGMNWYTGGRVCECDRFVCKIYSEIYSLCACVRYILCNSVNVSHIKYGNVSRIINTIQYLVNSGISDRERIIIV